MSVALTVSAEISFTETEPTDLGKILLEYGPGEEEMTEYTGNFANLEQGGGSFCNKSEGVARYEFTVEKDGIYSFVVEYIAREGKDRSIDVALDSQTNNQWVDLVESGDPRWAIITYELTAGTHNFFIMAPTGFDDDTVKSCDIYGWDLYLVEEIVPEEPEVDIEASGDSTPFSSAPSTSDAGIVAAAAIMAVAAGVVLSKKH